MSNEKSMDEIEAMYVINYYVQEMGYPTFEEFHNTESLQELKESVKNYETTYLEALLVAGKEHYGLIEKSEKDETGIGTVHNRWYFCVAHIKDELKKRQTVQYKQDYIRKNGPSAVRTQKDDEESKRKNMSLTMAPSTGNSKKDMKQTQLNLERMEHIKALERSLAAGGSIRTACDNSYNRYKDHVDNMPSNEEAKKMVEDEKRKKRPWAALVSLLTMPFYVLARGLELVMNPLIFRWRREGNIMKTGFFALPATIACFVAITSSMLPGFEDSSEAIFNCFLPVFSTAFLAIIMLREVLGIPFVFIRKGLEYVIEEHISWRFYVDEEWANKQLNPIEGDLRVYDYFQKEFEKRENLVAQLRDAIENNLPYDWHIDDLRKHGNLSLKELNNEVKRKAKRQGKQQKKIEQKG